MYGRMLFEERVIRVMVQETEVIVVGNKAAERMVREAEVMVWVMVEAAA